MSAALSLGADPHLNLASELFKLMQEAFEAQFITVFQTKETQAEAWKKVDDMVTRLIAEPVSDANAEALKFAWYSYEEANYFYNARRTFPDGHEDYLQKAFPDWKDRVSNLD